MLFNLFFSMLCKALQVICGVISIGYLVSALGVEHYGVWVTMTSIVVWMSLFDFGVGYGVKNRLTEALVNNDQERIASLVSMIIKFYLILAIALTLIFFLLTFSLEPFSSYPDVSLLLVLCAGLSFFLSSGSMLLQALGLFRHLYLLGLLSPTIWLMFLFSAQSSELTFQMIGFVYVFLITSQAFLIFFTAMRNFGSLHSLFKVNFPQNEFRKIVISGARFFVLQISALGLFMMGNFISYNAFGSADAAAYDTINRIYQLFNVGFSIFIQIFWVEISKAKASGDKAKKLFCFKALIALSAITMGVALLFAYYISDITELISHGKVMVSSSQAIPFFLLISAQCISYSGAVFMNAYEELKVQVGMALFALPLFYGLLYAFISMGMDYSAVPLATAIALLPSMTVCLNCGYKLAKQ